MNYTSQRSHPFITFLKLTFFLYVLYLAARLLLRTTFCITASVVIVVSLLVATIIPPWRDARSDLVELLERVGIYWAEVWEI